MTLPGIHLLKGYKLIFSKGYKRYSLLPILINALCFIGLYYWALTQSWSWLDVEWSLPTWMSWLEPLWQWVQPILFWLAYAVTAVLLLFVTGFIASLVSIVIASPFHSLLCEKILVNHGKLNSMEASWITLALEAIQREMAKLVYLSWRSGVVFIVCLPFLWVPVLNVLASGVLMALGAWMLAMEYTDFAFEANKQPFNECRHWLKTHKTNTLGFGLSCLAAASIPIFNFFCVPAGIAGATLLYLDHH